MGNWKKNGISKKWDLGDIDVTGLLALDGLVCVFMNLLSGERTRNQPMLIESVTKYQHLQASVPKVPFSSDITFKNKRFFERLPMMVTFNTDPKSFILFI